MVDFDSTINDFHGAFLGAINQKYETRFIINDDTEWGFLKSYEGQGMTREMEDYAWGLWQTRSFTTGLHSLPGAILALHRLTDTGNAVIVVSSRPLSHAQWIREWLDDKGLTQIEAWANPMKLEFAQEFKVSLAFEDNPDHALALATYCPVYLINAPWNRDVVDDNITRVDSLWCAVEDMGI